MSPRKWDESLPEHLYVIENRWSHYYHSSTAVKGVITRLRKWHERGRYHDQPFRAPKIMIADVINWREVEPNDADHK